MALNPPSNRSTHNDLLSITNCPDLRYCQAEGAWLVLKAVYVAEHPNQRCLMKTQPKAGCFRPQRFPTQQQILLTSSPLQAVWSIPPKIRLVKRQSDSSGIKEVYCDYHDFVHCVVSAKVVDSKVVHDHALMLSFLLSALRVTDLLNLMQRHPNNQITLQRQSLSTVSVSVSHNRRAYVHWTYSMQVSDVCNSTDQAFFLQAPLCYVYFNRSAVPYAHVGTTSTLVLWQRLADNNHRLAWWLHQQLTTCSKEWCTPLSITTSW